MTIKTLFIMTISNNTDYQNISKKEQAIQRMLDELEKPTRLLGMDERFEMYISQTERFLEEIYQAKLVYDKSRNR